MIERPTSNPITLNGACHCGAVRFIVTLPRGFASARRCTCSICRMRGAIAVSAQVGAIEITAGQDKLATYQFNTMTAKHHFCSVCGIYTHHQRRSNPDQYGVNVACLQGVSPFDFEEVKVLDGQNHPSDTGVRSDLVGVLRFIPVDQMAEEADRR